MTEPTGCGKRRYPTKARALYSASRALKKPKNDTVALRSYRCPDCGGWHLTSLVKPRLRDRPGGVA